MQITTNPARGMMFDRNSPVEFHELMETVRQNRSICTPSCSGSRSILVLLTLVILSPLLAMADVQWHKFDSSAGDKETFSLGRVEITIEVRKVQTSGFPDDLLMTVKTPGQKPRQHYFTSAYASGAVAINGNILLLKYGVGRGTFAREDHITALRLDYYLQELVDVQSSYYVLTDPHNAAPDLFEYQVKIQEAGGYTTLTLWLPKPQKGIPSEKIVRWKNDA